MDLHISKEALEDLEGVTVPLVAYDADGTKHTIGQATFETDEHGLKFDAKINPEHAAVIQAVTALPEGFSISSSYKKGP